MKTFASIFSDGELAGIGAMAAGLTPIWGVECDPDIAATAEANSSSRVIVDYAQNVDYSKLESPHWLHMSPVCTRASVAKTDGEESPLDIEMAQACTRAITALKPPVVSLENVWGYVRFKAFHLIVDALHIEGYKVKYWHLNSADYGVPQTRKRLILVATLEGIPRKPSPTHRPTVDQAQSLFFGSLPAWVGWYEAIEDLIPSLPESQFADWQLKRLPDVFTDNFLMDSGNSRREWGESFHVSNEPIGSIQASQTAGKYRAFIAHPNADNDWFLTRDADEPCFTIKANNNGIPRTFIVPGDNSSNNTIRSSDEPITTLSDPKAVAGMRAFIVGSDSHLPVGNRKPVSVRVDSEPMTSITNSAMKSRAWLSQGKVVSMTPRALARFQSIPDSYRLPDKNSLACRVIGNAVPPLLMQRIIEAQAA